MSLIWVGLIFKSLFTSRWWKVSLKVSWWWWWFIFHVGVCLPHPRNPSSYSQLMSLHGVHPHLLSQRIIRSVGCCHETTIFRWQVEPWIHTVTHRIHVMYGILYLTFAIKINHPCRWIYYNYMDPRGWLLQKSQVRPKHLDDVFRDPLEAGYHLTGGLLRLRYGALGRRFFVPKKNRIGVFSQQEMRHGFFS